MKVVISIILILLALCFAMILLPLCIAIIVAQLLWLLYMTNGEISLPDNDECPYCGSGDTDGNHCYDCDEDF